MEIEEVWKKSTTQFWICYEPFDRELDPKESIDIDHCNFSEQFLGWAHENCNRAERYINFTPVVGIAYKTMILIIFV